MTSRTTIFPAGNFRSSTRWKPRGTRINCFNVSANTAGVTSTFNTFHWTPAAAFFIKGDSGSDIHDLVAHFEGEPIVYKHYPNAFRETNLLEMLNEWGIERVVICGMMTHLCVDATARAASDLGFQILVAEDACATRDLKYGGTVVPAELAHKSFLAALKSYGRVMKTEEILALLAAEAPR